MVETVSGTRSFNVTLIYTFGGGCVCSSYTADGGGRAILNANVLGFDFEQLSRKGVVNVERNGREIS